MTIFEHYFRLALTHPLCPPPPAPRGRSKKTDFSAFCGIPAEETERGQCGGGRGR